MSEKGKDRLFIAYANYSLREDPKNFIKIFDVGDRSNSLPPSPTDKYLLRKLVEAIVECEFSKKAFVESVISKKPDPNVRLIYPDLYLMYAIETLYGYRDGYCEYQCPFRKIREENWGREPFEGSDRLKCIECDQCEFVRVLGDVVDGIPYTEIIDGLLSLAKHGYFAETSDRHPVTERSGKRLEDNSSSHDSLFTLDDTSSKCTFREEWNGLIYIDLLEFLKEDNNNLRRLKLCPYCNQFFMARDAKKERCYSRDCKRKYYKWYMSKYRQLDG